MDHNWFGICPFATAQRLIQGKWAIWVLHHLSDGPVRFHTLQRKMPKMTHANLSTQLKQFEAEDSHWESPNSSKGRISFR